MDDTLVRMPKLADTLVEGTVGQWLKQVGETVGQGEPLASIETDKVTPEITSPAAGTLLELLVLEGQTVPVETVIARIGAAETAPSLKSPQPRPTLPRVRRTSATLPNRRPSPVSLRRSAELSSRARLITAR